MTLLVTTRDKDAFFMLPRQRRMEITEGTFAFIEKQRNAGKCKEIYEYSDLRGIVSVWEVESDEGVARLILENPMTPFVDMGITPVIDYDVAVKAVREAQRR